MGVAMASSWDTPSHLPKQPLKTSKAYIIYLCTYLQLALLQGNSGDYGLFRYLTDLCFLSD